MGAGYASNVGFPKEGTSNMPLEEFPTTAATNRKADK